MLILRRSSPERTRSLRVLSANWSPVGLRAVWLSSIEEAYSARSDLGKHFICQRPLRIADYLLSAGVRAGSGHVVWI